MKLRAHVFGAEPWILDDADDDLGYSLEEVIDTVAEQTAEDAGSDLLESPESWCRDLLRDRVVSEMGAALCVVGDSYRAPDGVLYTLENGDA